jgi:hypothetical protein
MHIFYLVCLAVYVLSFPASTVRQNLEYRWLLSILQLTATELSISMIAQRLQLWSEARIKIDKKVEAPLDVKTSLLPR